MEFKQKTELKTFLAPQLRQSLKVLALPLASLKAIVQEELENNPIVEESPLEQPPSSFKNLDKVGLGDLDLSYLSKKPGLQDILLRQLAMFTDTDEDLIIGQEIIGNIDESGYLKASLEEISSTLKVPLEKTEETLKIVQRFDPPGVACRTIQECFLLQLEAAGETDPILKKLLNFHLEDLAKKKFNQIAKALSLTLDSLRHLVSKILKLDPKPGRQYSSEEACRIIPDIIISENHEDQNLECTINDEDLPVLNINKAYSELLKKNDTDPQTREFLKNKLGAAMELIRAISKRQKTLKKIIEELIQLQSDALRYDLSYLKPLTFRQLAEKLNVHETTVCRAVMNKYVQTPWGIIALKDLFSGSFKDQSGQSISSVPIKRLIKELIGAEDKKQPLSDQEISHSLANELNLQISRRTVAKYREELKILSTSFRRER